MIKVFEILGGGVGKEREGGEGMGAVFTGGRGLEQKWGVEFYPAPNIFNAYITHRTVRSIQCDISHNFKTVYSLRITFE